MSTQTHRPTEQQAQNDERTLEDALAEMDIQPAGYNDTTPLVERCHAPLTGSKQSESPELFETLRDALNLETKLKINPPGRWTPDRTAARTRSWTGYGYDVRLETTLFGPWRLAVDDEIVLEGASRMDAFREAARRMREIAMTEC